MTDDEKIKLPPRLPQIMAETTRLKFAMASDPLTGCLLRTLAATKPGGNFLELGTGTGVATAWLLDGMDRRSSLISVEKDETVLAVARKFLGHDRRVDFFQVDAGWWLGHAQCFFFDLIFADSWPGKYDHLDEALDMLN
ncbi:MAG TPA: SAM-dependent methyltransferase, partial [Blastocatellia bacterium]